VDETKKRTQAEVAKLRDVNIRTVKRWAKAGVDLQSDESIGAYLETRKHSGKPESDRTPLAVASNSTPSQSQPLEPIGPPPSFRTTEDLIANLDNMASTAFAELRAARLAGASGPSVARLAKVFNDSINQLRLTLLERDRLQASSGTTYASEEIFATLSPILLELRFMLQNQIVVAATNAAAQAGLIEVTDRAKLEACLQTVVVATLFPCLCETGAHFASLMLKNRHLSTLKDRQRLFEEMVLCWKGGGDES
jgi:hypothetical protein